MVAVILAGGKGTRLAPYTTVFPKPLMPIDGMPILEVIVRQLAHFRIKEMIFTVSQQSEPLLSAYFGDGSRYGVNDPVFPRRETSWNGRPSLSPFRPSGNLPGDERGYSDHAQLSPADPVPSAEEGDGHHCHESEEGSAGIGCDGV